MRSVEAIYQHVITGYYMLILSRNNLKYNSITIISIQFSMTTGGVLPGPVILHLSAARWAGLPPSSWKLMVTIEASTLGVSLIIVAVIGTVEIG